MLVLQSVKGYNIFICGSNDAGRRLDRILKKMLPDVPAGLIYSGIRKGLIKVNGRKSRQSYRLQDKDEISVKKSVVTAAGKNDHRTEPEAADRLSRITILRTENILLLSKPAGLLTHGENSLATLIDRGLAGVEPSLSFRPAPLHRLDRNTSGLIAVSLTIDGAAHFSELMRERRIGKYYIGICLDGPLKETRLVDNLSRNRLITKTTSPEDPAGVDDSVKTGITTASPILTKGRFSLTLFRIETGLTHQIRAQSSAAGFPLAGDVKYGGGIKGFSSFYLHSFSLSLPEHDDICGFRNCTAPVPKGFAEKAAGIFGNTALDSVLNRLKSEISQ